MKFCNDCGETHQIVRKLRCAAGFEVLVLRHDPAHPDHHKPFSCQVFADGILLCSADFATGNEAIEHGRDILAATAAEANTEAVRAAA